MKTLTSNENLFSLLKKLWNKLSSRRQKQIVLLLGLMLISAFAEVISLGAVLPFIGVLVAPAKLLTNPTIANIIPFLRINSPPGLILFMTVVFASMVLVAAVLRIFLLWVSTRVSYSCGADLSLEVYRRTLYQPYQVHVSRNSSEVINGIMHKVDGVAVGVLLSIMTIISSGILIVAITITMFLINPKIALLAVIGFGASYYLISVIFRRRLRVNSQRIASERTGVIKALQEGLGGIRDVLLDSTQAMYCDIYNKADQPLRLAAGNNLFIAQSPRYVMESFGILLVVGLAYFLSNEPGGIAVAMPVLGALALGAQRLLPALQLVYASWATIVGHYISLLDTIALLEQPLPQDMAKVVSPMSFQKEIVFKDVYFRYADDTPWILDGLNLTIPRGSRVGFVGTTGSGKSTTLDLVMGLLKPTTGSILIDGTEINEMNVRSWQRNIAHVPQNIYLADTTLAENIAFGVQREDIDMVRVQEAAKKAQISEFIESKPAGYDAFLGERGVQLSGGQRQRTGIARALYKKADVLVFDEATSALDTTTEQSVMRAIESLDSKFTILLVAHRVTTLQNCDFIIEMEKGKIVALGTYEQLLEKSSTFKKSISGINKNE